MNWSYWERKYWLGNNEVVVVGSGIVGLSCALAVKERFPKYSVLVLEKGILPRGASTKNAGFACTGSISEILEDLKDHDEEKVFRLVEMRWEGLQILRDTVGDEAIDFKNYGGYGLFLKKDEALLEHCIVQLPSVNQLLSPIFGEAPFKTVKDPFKFQNTLPTFIFQKSEGQIDTGKMMTSLLKKAISSGVRVLNGVTVHDFLETKEKVTLNTSLGEIATSQLCIATNGFASLLIGGEVQPARAQVLVTEPVEGLSIKGTFHLDRGYNYFRDIDGRILLGGGRNLDISGETTTEEGLTDAIQEHLERLLHQVILPEKEVAIAHRWSGIMGVGGGKTPIIKKLSDRVCCGVRLGGMGVAIGSIVGKKMADLL